MLSRSSFHPSNKSCQFYKSTVVTIGYNKSVFSTDLAQAREKGVKYSGLPTLSAQNRLGKLLLVCCLFLLSLPSFGETATPTITLYHYNPESYSGRSLVLKSTFDRYFESTKHLTMQPVEDKATFHNIVKQESPHLYIVSDWDFRQLSKLNPNLTPYLRGQKDGGKHFLKFLVATNGISSVKKDKRPTLAISGSQQYTLHILNNMDYRDQTNPIKNPRFLTVPKDIDALLAVSFGLADAALATENNVEKLSHLYQKEYQQLQILGVSKPQNRMVVALDKNHLKRLQRALEIIEAMDTSQEGKLGLNLLGLDGWKKLHSANGRLPQ